MKPARHGAPEGPSPFLAALRDGSPMVTAELRPPRADLSGQETLDVWIDTYHAVRRLTRAGRFVLLTDNAVGTAEEENLAHLEGNLPDEADPAHVVPFLTCKHTLDYCLTYAQRAWSRGFRALTVLGGDTSGGPPRCVPHAYVLRQRIREHVPDLALGGWANPHGDPAEQAGYLADPACTADFFLTQVVSHHSVDRVERFLDELARRGNRVPGVFGVFYYRSANPGTLGRLARFFPVPSRSIAKEFEAGATAEDLCARTLRALRRVGASNAYVSNLPVRNAAETLEAVLKKV
ncbi:MAG TPA: hypothetical protein VE173_08905 [Longimicrobiales bacterium]|nr:hypothetical protein [Longimicrobiales bacterium]